jgi:2-polyprenyl-3-methyl-5-hydroxy-6-metoxy-1,4-benzoquinol methylase
MTNVITNSWNTFTEEYSKNYLNDADSVLPKTLSNFIFKEFSIPNLIDIGCGNARLYNYLLNEKRDFSYEGFDISEPLINAAKVKYEKNKNFYCKLVDSKLTDLSQINKKFDIAVCTHLVELCESPENLFHTMTNLSDTVGIIWYEYPRFEYTQLEIRNYVSHDMQEKNIITPYLRNRYSKYYLKFLMDRFSLKSIHKICISEKDVLEIYKKYEK